jgi:hypothetical protein
MRAPMQPPDKCAGVPTGMLLAAVCAHAATTLAVITRNRRWTGLAGVLALATTLALGPAASAQTLKVVMHWDVKILDPIWTTAYIVRNHGYMVYDTLMATDDKFQVRPQMLEVWTGRVTAAERREDPRPAIPIGSSDSADIDTQAAASIAFLTDCVSATERKNDFGYK